MKLVMKILLAATIIVYSSAYSRARYLCQRINQRRLAISPEQSAREKEEFLFPDVEAIGISGRWEEVEGNFVLRPPLGETPLGVIHFLGGAFVGAITHIYSVVYTYMHMIV
jgi:hypothetical protein